jgi:hypothetical protein
MPLGNLQMVATLLDFELRQLDRMTRQELVAALRFRRDLLQADLVGCLEEKSLGQLQLLLLVARLTEVLQHMQGWCPARCT